MDTETTSGSLIAADKVEGTSVYNRAGEKLGSVDDIMIDKTSGRVAYAVMSFGGFLGIGEKLHPLPWSKLDYSKEKGGYVVDIDKTMLEKAPMYARDERVDWASPEWNKKVYDYYGDTVFW